MHAPCNTCNLACMQALSFMQVPIGTTIKDTASGTLVADLLHDGESCEVVKGGEGGLGNALFCSEFDRRPIECTLGENGEEKVVEVEMKTIADVGLVSSLSPSL